MVSTARVKSEIKKLSYYLEYSSVSLSSRGIRLYFHESNHRFNITLVGKSATYFITLEDLIGDDFKTCSGFLYFILDIIEVCEIKLTFSNPVRLETNSGTKNYVCYERNRSISALMVLNMYFEKLKQGE